MTSFTYNSSSVTHVNAIPLLNEADELIHLLLTRQSVHVDSLGGQADAHVPAHKRKRFKLLVKNVQL